VRETGEIVQLIGSSAEVRLTKTSACDKCSLCQKTGQGAMITRASNRLGAGPGDTVIIDTSSAKVVVAASLVFILPLTALIVGLGLGDVLARRHDVTKEAVHFVSLVCGLVCLGLCYTGIHFFDKKIQLRGNWRPRIVKIVKSAV